MNIRVVLMLVVLSAIGFSACNKTNNCPAKSNVTISANANSLTQGWDLRLSANYSSLNTYRWTGPNGWSVQTSSAVVTRTNMQFQDAGTYSVKVFNMNNCEIQEGFQAITVIPVESAPCEAGNANNTFTSDIPGLNSLNLSPVYFGGTPGGDITVTGYTNGTTIGGAPLTFTFSGSTKPRPGTYKTIYGYKAVGKEDEVSINLYNAVANEWFIAEQGHPVYVTLVNGKTQICICNIPVTKYLLASSPKYISCKMTPSN